MWSDSIKKFFKLALYDSERDIFDISKLVRMEATDILVEYFTIFNKDEYYETLETISDICLANKNLQLKNWNIKKDGFKNAFTAWSDVVQNLDNVTYLQSIIINNKKINYEIKSGINTKFGIPNLHVVLRQLFPRHYEIQVSKTLKNTLRIILNGKKSEKKVTRLKMMLNL